MPFDKITNLGPIDFRDIPDPGFYTGERTIFIASHRRPSWRSRIKNFFRIFGLAIGVSALAAWTMMALVLTVFGWPCDW